MKWPWVHRRELERLEEERKVAKFNYLNLRWWLRSQMRIEPPTEAELTAWVLREQYGQTVLYHVTSPRKDCILEGVE